MEQLKCIRKQWLHLATMLHLAFFTFWFRSIAELPGWNRHQESTALWKPAMSFSRVRKGKSVASITDLTPDGHVSWKTMSQQKELCQPCQTTTWALHLLYLERMDDKLSAELTTQRGLQWSQHLQTAVTQHKGTSAHCQQRPERFCHTRSHHLNNCCALRT